MSKVKFFIGTLVMMLTLFITNSCTENNPIIVLPDTTTGPTQDGDLEVFVRQGTSTGPFIGGALVEIFLSDVDRINGDVYQSNLTDLTDPINKGALFKGLKFQKYYIQASFQNTQGSFDGTGESFVPKGTKTQIHVTCIP
jgi:hypothetical protein